MMLIGIFILYLIIVLIITAKIGAVTGIAAVWGGIASVLFAASFYKDIQDPITLRIVSGILFLMAVYLSAEALRFGYWRDYYYNPSDDTASKPPPTMFIVRVIRWLKGL